VYSIRNPENWLIDIHGCRSAMALGPTKRWRSWSVA
jgi:hypothetical protein